MVTAKIGNPIADSEPDPRGMNSAGVPSKPGSDHIFGDVFGTVKGGLEGFFGEVNLPDRMNAYDGQLRTIYTTLKNLDLGHKPGIDAISVTRTEKTNAVETDQQDARFSFYSQRFKWRLCQYVVTNSLVGSSERREIYKPGDAGAWRTYVIEGLNGLMVSLVDGDALDYYLRNPGKDRNVGSNPFTHQAISLDALKKIVKTNNTPNSKRIRSIIKNFDIFTVNVTNIVQIISEHRSQKYEDGVWKDL